VSTLPRAATARELQQVLAAERGGVPFLLYRGADGELCLRLLDGSAPVTVGRGPAADVSLSWDPGVSLVHAELVPRSGTWLVVDEGISRNGTFVNGARLQGRRRMRAGDTIRVGHTSLAFHEGETISDSTTAPLTTAGGLVAVTDAQRRVLVALCRPFADGRSLPLPATNGEIAAELFLGVEAVKTHMRELYRRFGLEHVPQHEKRARLAHRAIELGVASPPT
jgi:hypothetical protein